MKTMRKILQISVTVLSIFGIFAASSCTKIAGNSIDYYRLPADLTFTDGKAEFYGRNGQTLIDIGEKTFSYPKSDEENYSLYENIAVCGGTAPRYSIEIAEGYESIRTHLENLHIPNNDESVIYTHGYLLNGKIYGICNTYKKTIGYLSGGGNYGVEEIAFSVYYEYTAETDEFVILRKTEGAFFVAFSGDNVVYWRSKKFYVSDGKTDAFICDDLAYDSGIRHQSRNTVYFTDDYVIFEMIKAKSTSDIYNMFVYDFTEKTVTELESFKENYL